MCARVASRCRLVVLVVGGLWCVHGVHHVVSEEDVVYAVSQLVVRRHVLASGSGRHGVERVLLPTHLVERVLLPECTAMECGRMPSGTSQGAGVFNRHERA